MLVVLVVLVVIVVSTKNRSDILLRTFYNTRRCKSCERLPSIVYTLSFFHTLFLSSVMGRGSDVDVDFDLHPGRW